MRERIEAKFGMGPEERVDDFDGLTPSDGQDRVDRGTARAHAARSPRPGIATGCVTSSGILAGGHRPARVGVSAPASDARAGGIDQDAVVARGLAGGVPAVPDLGRDVVKRAAAEPHRAIAAACRSCSKVQTTTPLPPISAARCMACRPFSRVDVPPSLAGVGVADDGHALGGDVLGDEPPGLEQLEAPSGRFRAEAWPRSGYGDGSRA